MNMNTPRLVLSMESEAQPLLRNSQSY